MDINNIIERAKFLFYSANVLDKRDCVKQALSEFCTNEFVSDLHHLFGANLDDFIEDMVKEI